MTTEQKRNNAFRGGQSIVEYIILVATVIALLLVLFRPGGPFTRILSNTLEQQGQDIADKATAVF